MASSKPVSSRTTSWNRAFIALGSNLGDRSENIARALDEMAAHPHISLVKTSSLYETEPVDLATTHWFLNAVAEIRTDLEPAGLLAVLGAIERDLGRDRTRGSDRTIDLDILTLGDIVLDREGLTIPHPRLQERRFVLESWNEIAPDYIIPVLSRTVGDLLSGLPRKGPAVRVPSPGPGGRSA